ncbi:BlaI/MecI/CopY family transcriptional regulator [Streptomyces sp. NPDC059740]|uniref:BlaI/MecI/CopY family transcriptional regulator n=1 Tax=Streptomyces sp. NPDC059740 TaxID=3346926 RepID=UPI00364885E9
MTRIWEWNRPVTVREVLEDLRKERSIAYTTVMTVLDNLHQKGWVRREAEGRAYRYEAVSTRAAYAAALMNESWSASDNPAAALVAFFGMMSPEQREALREAVHMLRIEEPAPSPDAGPAAGSEQAEDRRAATGNSAGDHAPAQGGYGTGGSEGYGGAAEAPDERVPDSAESAEGENAAAPGGAEPHRSAPESER